MASRALVKISITLERFSKTFTILVELFTLCCSITESCCISMLTQLAPLKQQRGTGIGGVEVEQTVHSLPSAGVEVEQTVHSLPSGIPPSLSSCISPSLPSAGLKFFLPILKKLGEDCLTFKRSWARNWARAEWSPAVKPLDRSPRNHDPNRQSGPLPTCIAVQILHFTALACSEGITDVSDGRCNLLGGVVSPQPKPDFPGRISDLDDPFPPRPLPNSPKLPNPVNRRRRCFLHLRNRPLLAGLNDVNINGSFNIDFMDISPYSSPLIQLLFVTGRIGSIQVRYRYPNLLQIGGAIHRPLPALENIPGFKATEGLASFFMTWRCSIYLIGQNVKGSIGKNRFRGYYYFEEESEGDT
nr:hypothetical protein Iba_chr12eCG14350 [Ipomoea batatas]